MTETSYRLNKFLAMHMNIGRRRADELIVAGKVLVDGKPPILGARVTAHTNITVNGKPVAGSAPHFSYLLMNKPVGYICSRSQQGDTPTIYTLLPAKYQHLKTVGRLDKNSSGLLLLTNDGDLAHKLTHPSFTKVKKYEVTLSTPLAPLHHQMINDHGVTLADGPSKLQLTRLHEGNDHAWLVTMHEGRNRQIRRTFEALGYHVTTLHRVQFGTYTLGQLQNKQILPIPGPN